jgi:hypothetical protein
MAPPHSLTLWARLLLSIPGKPRSSIELQRLEDGLADRFAGNWEYAVEYVNRHHDRLLNQSRGLLTFDGLVLAALGVLYRESHRIPASLVLGGYASAILATSILLVSQFSVYLGEPNRFQDPKKEFSSSLRQTVVDAKTIVVADILSLVAMLSLLVALGFLVFRR